MLKVAFAEEEEAQAQTASLAYKTATEVSRHLLAGLAERSIALDTRGDTEACLRLIRRLASPPWPAARVHDSLLRQLIGILYQSAPREVSAKEVRRWGL